MSTRTLKVLATSTALVAAASAAQADVSGTITGTITDASASTVVNVSGTSTVVSVSGMPAVIVSGTGTYTLRTSASSILRSDATSGTINMGAVASTSAITGGVTINNSGSIINTNASGYAISLTDTMISTLQPSVTIANTGTISGSIATGSQNDTLTNTGGTVNGAINLGAGTNTVSNTGTITGAITTTGGADTITNRGTITGAIDVGAGSNVIENLNGTITGNITATTNGDNLHNAGGTITGDVNLGDGANIVRLASSSTLTGALTLGSDNDTLYISNSSVITGAVDTGTGTNTTHVSDTNFTQRANWTFGGTDTLNVSGTYNVSGTITGLDNLVLAQGATFNTSQSIAAMTSIAANSATVRVAAGKIVTTSAITVNNDSILKFDVASSTAAGRVDLNGAGFGGSKVSVTAVFANNTGFIASGTTFLLVDGGATTSATLTDTNVGVYRLSLRHNIDTGNDISLLVGRVSTSTLADNGSNAAIGTTLDNLSASTNAGIVNLQNLISKQTTTAGVNTVLEQLNPATDTGAAMASVNVATETGNNVSARLAALRGTAMTTGDMMGSGHMWVQGFGSTAEQDDKGGFKGYDSNSAGVTFGADSDTVMDGHTVGAAFTYGNSSVDSKNSNNAETQIDSYMGTVYGSRVFDEGYFVNAQGSVGYNKYDMKRTVTGLGQADGDTNGWQAGLKGEIGRDLECNAMTVTPAFGLAYNHLSMDEYTETGIGGAGLTVNPDAVNTLDASLGATVAWNLPMDGGSTLKPALRAKYGYRMGDDTLESTTNFIGAPGTAFTTSGVKADRSSLGLGAGLNWLTEGGVDLSVNYDADLRSKYTGHTGQVKARWAF